jgi:protein arginine kinase
MPGSDQPGPVWDRTRLPSLCGQRTEWLRGQGEASDVVMSSRVRLARNLAGFPFMPKAERRDREQVLELCRGAITGANLSPHLMWIDLHHATTLERTLLVERQLISRQHARGKLSSGQGGTDEPRAVAVGLPEERLSIMVNEEDHLRIQSIRCGLDLASAQERGEKADDAIEGALEYAFSPRFGYLTACPTNVGTGARFSVMLHLPGLRMTGEIEKVKHAADDMGLAVRGFYGEGSEAAGDFFQLSNQVTLGRTERNLLDIMQGEIVPKVVEFERRARDVLLGKRRRATEDAIFRAVGILENARLLSAEEAMNLLSQARLGVLLRLVTGIEPDRLHDLMLLVHNAHLDWAAGRELEPHERGAARADLVRERLRGGAR